jgi:hypothetical protein
VSSPSVSFPLLRHLQNLLRVFYDHSLGMGSLTRGRPRLLRLSYRLSLQADNDLNIRKCVLTFAEPCTFGNRIGYFETFFKNKTDRKFDSSGAPRHSAQHKNATLTA